MPTDLNDASTGGPSLVFPDEAPGVRFRLREALLFDAVEVREEVHDGEAITDDEEASDEGQPPAWGRWLPVEIDGDDAWLTAPGEIVDELQRLDAEPGEVYEVTRLEKSGTRATDPYEANLEPRDDQDQTRF